GRGAQDLRGQGWRETIHPEDRERVFGAWSEATGNREPLDLTYRLVHSDGRLIWVRAKSAPIHVCGALTGHVGIIEDVTREREAAEMQRQSEERLRYALEAGSDGYWDWNVATGAAYMSPGLLAMLGYGPGEVEGHHKTWESWVHPDDLPGVLQQLTAHLEGTTPLYQVELRLRTKAGDWVWSLDSGRVIERDEQGRPLRM